MQYVWLLSRGEPLSNICPLCPSGGELDTTLIPSSDGSREFPRFQKLFCDIYLHYSPFASSLCLHSELLLWSQCQTVQQDHLCTSPFLLLLLLQTPLSLIRRISKIPKTFSKFEWNGQTQWLLSPAISWERKCNGLNPLSGRSREASRLDEFQKPIVVNFKLSSIYLFVLLVGFPAQWYHRQTDQADQQDFVGFPKLGNILKIGNQTKLFWVSLNTFQKILNLIVQPHGVLNLDSTKIIACAAVDNWPKALGRYQFKTFQSWQVGR